MSVPNDAILFMPANKPAQYTGNLYIMRAVPGCGKTHRAERLAAQVGGLLLSADHFYGEGEAYRKNWSRERAHLGHRDCESKCLTAMKNLKSSIIIDNTNIALQGFRYYLDIAVDHNYVVYCVYPDSPWWGEKVFPFLKHKMGVEGEVADLLVSKNTHGVPRDTIIDMMHRFQWPNYDDYLESCDERLNAAYRELNLLKQRYEKVKDMYI